MFRNRVSGIRSVVVVGYDYLLVFMEFGNDKESNVLHQTSVAHVMVLNYRPCERKKKGQDTNDAEILTDEDIVHMFSHQPTYFHSTYTCMHWFT